MWLAKILTSILTLLLLFNLIVLDFGLKTYRKRYNEFEPLVANDFSQLNNVLSLIKNHEELKYLNFRISDSLFYEKLEEHLKMKKKDE